MIYRVKYSLLKKSLAVYSPVELDLERNAIAEIDGEKWYVSPQEKLPEESVAGHELGSNHILQQAVEADEIHYDLQMRRCFHFTSKVNEIARKADSSIRVLACEPLFDVRRIVFYFKVFEKFVNFRTVVKETRNLVKTQVDFQQVQGREMTKVFPTIGACGLQTCCSRFLHETPIIKQSDVHDMWANKRQSLGICGRIKCCSAFEKGCCKEGCEKCENKSSL